MILFQIVTLLLGVAMACCIVVELLRHGHVLMAGGERATVGQAVALVVFTVSLLVTSVGGIVNN